jgi:hypothetical protein
MSYKKEYLIGYNRIKILLIKNDNYSILDFFVNDLLTFSISYSNFEKLVLDAERLEKMFVEYLNRPIEKSVLQDKINSLGYIKTK